MLLLIRKLTFPFILIIPLFFLCQCSNNESKFILNENFDENKLGWPEEETSSHHLYIKNGNYYLKSIDTARYRSSVYSLEDQYMRNLPDEYVIKTSIDLINRSRKDRDITNFGLLLNSSSLEYEFSIYWHGLVKVTEYNNNTDSTITIFENQLTKMQSTILIDLKINKTRFELFINGKSIGSGKLKTQSQFWQNIRLYTTTGSTIVIDYLKIVKSSNIYDTH